MAADILTLTPRTFDPLLRNAYSPVPTFDMGPPGSASSGSRQRGSPGEMGVPELSMRSMPSRQWDVDVRGLVSTKTWLHNFGLKKNKLDMFHLLPQIGFKHSDDYDGALKKPVSSRYGQGMFQTYIRADGKTFNVSCTKEKLCQLEQRLSQAVNLYKQRLEWLTTESRRIFGVIEEKSVAIVLDINNTSPQLFDQYRTATERVLREQVAQIAKFNLIRATEDLKEFNKQCVPVTAESLESAIVWLWSLDRMAPVSKTATVEAVMQALNDPQLEAIYIFTEGSASDGAHALLREKVIGSRIPVHVVSYNCVESGTVSYLKDLCKISGGRFHAYAVTMEMDGYETGNGDPNSQSNLVIQKKTYRGVPPGAGMREDVILLFEELEEARSALTQITTILREMPDPKAGPKEKAKNMYEKDDVIRGPTYDDRSETYMGSREWLDRHGIKASKLGFYDVLAAVAFQHRDGVVDLKCQPGQNDFQTDAVTKQKLVNAKYCDRFPHVRWKDGQVVHVQVTPELHRDYECKVKLVLQAVQQRMDWLHQGSRELFGTVIENQIYILIDTSASMAPHIQFVKDKLFVLMQEQLRHKQKFNIVAFDSRVYAWQNHLVDVDERNLHDAWSWIKGLECKGSTNTMGALRQAFSDPLTQAIYLLSDGRPDQQGKSILAQVQLHPKVPIHTISFNCSDKEANQFLCDLAKESGGRFHYYAEHGIELEGPEPWESEDIRLLRQELQFGYQNLEKISLLRDECAALAWKSEDTGKNARQGLTTPRLYNSDMERPRSAPGLRLNITGPKPPMSYLRPHTARRSWSPKLNRPKSAQPPKLLYAAGPERRSYGNVAGHTRTSLLRSLNSSGQYSTPEWLLPETQALFQRQQQRLQDININEDNKKKKQKRKLKKHYTDQINMSSKMWLSKNGLAAKKLTILDAMAPTFIPHKPKYVPIINKNVLSKVFDDILPIAHASGDRKKIRIVNPQAVNLNDYIDKVETMVTKYKKRLDAIVWNALSPEDREQFESSEPVSFEGNRDKLMSVLDAAGWPLRERDIILLEREIRQAESYIRQAQDLITSSKQQAESDTEDKASVASSKFEGLGEAVQSIQKKSKKTSNKVTNHQRQRVLDLMKGLKVIARNSEDGFYYPGMVVKCPDSRHGLVNFEDIGQQVLPTRFIIPVVGAVAQPVLRIGDSVLCRVVNQDTDMECYVPGTLEMLPMRSMDQAKFYTVLLYTGQREHFLRGFLVKISKMRYSFLVRYIADLSRKRDNEEAIRTKAEIKKKESESRTSSKSRSGSRSRSSSRSRSQSRSSSGSRSRDSRSRSGSPAESKVSSRKSRTSDRNTNNGNSSELKNIKLQQHRLEKWQKLLERQQKQQKQQQKKLKRQVQKLENLHRKVIEAGGGDDDSEKKRLLELILAEVKDKKGRSSRTRSPKGKGRETSPGGHSNMTEDPNLRTQEWVKNSTSHSDEEDRPPFIMELRQTLPPLQVGEEVLARWSDEGWYYRGVVRQNCEDLSYFVEDSLGDLERIWREDIISDADDANAVIQKRDAVIGLHPNYAFSYAPGIVLDTEGLLWYTVRFYDGTEGRVPREELFRIKPDKFEIDVAYIIKCEDQWVGKAVVARNNDTGVFQLGAVRERVGNGRQYVIEWSDGQLCIQSSTHMFGPLTKHHPLSVGDHILAINHQEALLYLPGKVTEVKDGKISVNFCDGSKGKDLDSSKCFWLAQEYYENAVGFYKEKQGENEDSN